MGRRALVSPADLLRARARLDLTRPEDLAVVARAMGLGLRGVPAPELATRDVTAPPDRPTPAPEPPVGMPEPPLAAADVEPVPSAVVPEAPVVDLLTDVATLLANVVPLPWPPVEPPAPRRRPEPLLAPARTKAILFEFCAALGGSADVDVPRLVRTLAEGRAVRAVPTVERRTTALGAQLLVDRGPTMVPFHEDLLTLEDDTCALLGSSRLHRVWCEGSPWRVCADAGDDEDEPYRAPPSGVPVLAVTDLGLRAGARPGGGSGLRRWLDLADLLTARRSRLVALVPLAPDRVPAAATRRMTVVSWDRRTTVRQARRGIG